MKRTKILSVESQAKGPERHGRETADRSSSAGEPVRLTNPGKIYWPDEGITKGDLLDYYREMADVILPYLKDRPESLHRHPNGIKGVSFFQKDLTRQPPPPN